MVLANYNSRTQTIIDIAKGWASNSINTVVFRKNSITSLKGWQFVAFYDEHQHIIIAKRKWPDSSWQIKQTPFIGNCYDAHRSISIILDGDGFLHLSWNHHNNQLHYVKSKQPYSIDFTDELPMVGRNESNLTYPEFYRLPNGNLIFLYRSGGSGKGNLILNHYDIKTKQWTRLQENLLDGENKRNAYWQAYIDVKGTIHLSWVWRESPDVASNHDLCYARSKDGGIHWERSNGKKYALPINAATAEYAVVIPPNSELINQTSMYADDHGNPYIATYWRDQNSDVPQYRMVYKSGKTWKSQNLRFSNRSFSLTGSGTKQIPISRPQIIDWSKAGKNNVALIFRDEERGNKVSLAVNSSIKKQKWKLIDIHHENMLSWEPSYDTNLWMDKKILNLFIQKTDQADAEGKTLMPPQMVSILEWLPGRIKR